MSFSRAMSPFLRPDKQSLAVSSEVITDCTVWQEMRLLFAIVFHRQIDEVHAQLDERWRNAQLKITKQKTN